MAAVFEVSQAKVVAITTTKQEPSEIARLTRLMKQGDEAAYRTFFDLYFNRLLGYLLVVTRGNESLARDLLQQTMIKVAKHIRVFEDEEVLWRWLTVLARTSALDEHKKTRRYSGFLDRFWGSRTVPPERPIPDRDFGLIVNESLELMDPGDRALLEQKYIDGQSVKAIAQELGATEKSIESRLTRARARLKQHLMEELKNG